MLISAGTIIFTLFLFIFFIGGGIWLQIYLSKKNSKWPGLVLPIICLLFSWIIMMSAIQFSSVSVLKEEVVQMHGGGSQEIITPETNIEKFEKPSLIVMLFNILPVFLISNAPTMILLAIYFAVRSSRKKRLELEKMSIQDLE